MHRSAPNFIFALALAAAGAVEGGAADRPQAGREAVRVRAIAMDSGDAGRDSVAAPAPLPLSQAGAGDSAAAPDTAQGKKIYEYISYPMLQLVTLPVEFVLVPVVKLALYPTQAPLRYFLNENVIDRTIQLISFGRNDKIMLYPTLNLAPGTGSYTGLTLRHLAVFGRNTEHLVAQGSLYVNGDWRFRSYLTGEDILGTGFNSKLSVALVRVKNTSVNQPDTGGYWYYADTSNSFSGTLSRPVFEKFAVKGTFVYRDNHFGTAPPSTSKLVSPFFRNESGAIDSSSRGLESQWADRIFAAGVARDTRNNQNIPLAGSDFSATYHYHLTEKAHDFHGWEASLTNYFKLGKEKYEVSAAEERKAGSMSIRKVLKKVELENLRKELFNRKVLVTHLYGAQSYELPGNRMPVYGLQTLGNDTPLRGYGGSRFRDYTVLSWGAEYRFPIIRLVDGVIFDEYGVYGRSWDKIDYLERLRNSWGFGIRVRRPDIFLFRLQLGFHGLHGIQLNMSVDEPY